MSISADGRYVAFISSATDLVSSDGNGFSDVFVRDLQLGTTVRVSVDQAGGDPDGNSLRASISAGGRYVAFASEATDLVSSDDNGLSDVFVRDLQMGTTTRVSVTTSGDADGASDMPSISANGRYVAFQSNAFFVPEYGGCLCVYVRDLQQGVTIGVPPDFVEIDNQFGPSISADGRHVAFSSIAGGNQFVYAHDLQAGLTRQVSVDTNGGDPDGISAGGSMSGDGRYVAFASTASDLVAGGTLAFSQAYVRDMETDTTLLASADTFGVPSEFSGAPRLSVDGRYIAFVSRSDSSCGARAERF